MATKVSELSARLQAALGRPLRVLHIGNIANNAYHNARLLNAIGIESDVICHDYYHSMGCPEWEDADFEGEFGDHFRPDWTRVRMHGFSRPEWFAQGPRAICIAYLIAKRRGWKRRRQTLWRWLQYASRSRRPPMFLRQESLLARELFAEAAPWWLKPTEPDYRRPEIVRLPILGRRTFRKLWWRIGRTGVNVRGFFNRPRRFWISMKAAYRRVANWLEVEKKRNRRFIPTLPINSFLRDVTTEFQREFPGRPPLTEQDLAAFKGVIGEWRELFRAYDVVIGYSTDPILPFLAGVPYLALEHGTLREIPYQDTVVGRLTALAYRKAHHVFVTNSDCLHNARELAGTRVSLVNHPYDDKHAVNVSGAAELGRALRRRLDADYLVFFPTRHDWVPGTGYADKANDVFLRAFATLRSQGLKLGLVCCAWGKNVAQSKALLSASGCDSHVEWVEPMGIVRFERTAMAVDIVADQFKLGAFGGVTFKALAAGVPVMTYLDASLFSPEFPMPPVINVQREDEIHDALARLCVESGELRRIGQRSREWVDRYHNADSLLATEIMQFASLMGIDLETETIPLPISNAKQPAIRVASR